MKIEIDGSDQKVTNVLKGTFFTLGLMIVMVSYTLIWAFLFLVYLGFNDIDRVVCKGLIDWNTSLYILYFISSGFNVVSSIIQIIMNSKNLESNIPNYIAGFRSCILFICGLVILIGISYQYVNIKDLAVNKCDGLLSLNLSFIITEWIILVIFLLFVSLFCIIHFVIKKKRGRDKEIQKIEDIADLSNDGYDEIETQPTKEDTKDTNTKEDKKVGSKTNIDNNISNNIKVESNANNVNNANNDNVNNNIKVENKV